MAGSADKVLSQIDAALAKYDEARSRSNHDDCSDLPRSESTELLSQLAATLRRVAPAGSVYRAAGDDMVQKYGLTNAAWIPNFVGMLGAVRDDYAAGYMQEVRELVHADVFADFLEMADHLLDEAYKDAAAVLTGGVLEEHLRKLCQKNGVVTDSGGSPKKADRLNAELTKAGVYDKLDLKSVTAWLDLRNNAAHAKYDEYTREQVTLMIEGVRNFLTRHPA